MEKTTILEKTASNGNRITVYITEYCQRIETGYTVDGADQGMARIIKLDAPKGNATHYMRAGMSKLAVGFTADEAATIISLTDAAKIASPAEQMSRLMSEREQMVLMISGLMEEAGERRSREFDATDGVTDFTRAGNDHERHAQAIREKLTAFDAAHPEVLAKINADKAEDQRRFEASN